MPFKKILKVWNASHDDPQGRSHLKLMDVTSFRCEEDNDSLKILDSGGALVAEIGPGKQYERWMLTVEYPTLHQPLSSLSLTILKTLEMTRSVYTPAAPRADVVKALPATRPAVETGFTLTSR